MEFLHPERLWWLLLCPFLLLFIAAVGPRKRASIPRIASVMLRSALLAIPLLILAGPVESTTTPAAQRLDVLMDASRSVSPAARERAQETVAVWARNQALSTRVVEFGARPRMVPLPGASAAAPASRAEHERDLESDPNPAVALLQLVEPGRPRPPVVMFTDGAVEPPADFVAAGEHPTALLVPMAAGEGVNARLDDARVERDPARQEELALVLRGSASAEAKGVVRVFVDGTESRSHPATVAPGPFEISAPLGVLPPGRHVVGIWFDGGDAEPLDDEVGLIVDVPAPVPVMVVAPEGRSLVSAALKAQEIPHEVVTPPDVIQTPSLLSRAQVLILDRMAVEGLSSPEILGPISSLLVRGGGVLFVPRENPGELVAAPSRKFLDLLPFTGKPLEPKKEPPPKKPPPEKEGLKPPEPEKKKIERRPAPTLGLLLLIDCSSSMKGQNLRLAKEAAIAASEVLHPDDRVGVLAFNDEPLPIVPMTRAGERETIIDLISRLKAEGGTDFGPALDQAREIFRAENLQVKHCVLLSDGHSRLGKILERVENLARDGVTLSTVGVGPGVDVAMMSDMAERGRGKYNPAYSAESIPQIITVEAERIVTKSGARKPFEIEAKEEEPPAAPLPEPPPAKPDPPPDEDLPPEDAPKIATPIKAGWPAVYLKGVHPELAQGIFEWHRVEPAPHGWVALATKEGDPVAIHTYVGFGRLVALTVPLQGAAAGPLVNWDDYANFTSQVVRFLMPATKPERLQLRARAAGRAARLELIDVERQPGIADRVKLSFRDQRARPVAVQVRRAGDGSFDLEVPSDGNVAFVDVLATVEGDAGSGATSFPVGRSPEIARIGADLAGLNRWAEALQGQIQTIAPAALAMPAAWTVERRPASQWWLFVMIPLFLLDLFIKRTIPGSFEGAAS